MKIEADKVVLIFNFNQFISSINRLILIVIINYRFSLIGYARTYRRLTMWCCLHNWEHTVQFVI